MCAMNIGWPLRSDASARRAKAVIRVRMVRSGLPRRAGPGSAVPVQEQRLCFAFTGDVLRLADGPDLVGAGHGDVPEQALFRRLRTSDVLPGVAVPVHGECVGP